MTGLLVLSAWGLGVLNAHRRFFLPYAAPVLWSAAQIAALVIAGSLLHMRGEPLAMAIAWGALAGAFLQLVVLLPAARALLGALRPRLDLGDPSVREAARRLPGVLLGRGVIQLSGLIDTFLVSFLGTGANAIVNYAQTIYLLPMSLLGTGEAAVALPEMASFTAERDTARRDAALRTRLGQSLARVLVVTVPTTAIFLLFARELVALLLQTGAFDRAATESVVPVIRAYGLALCGNASARVLITACYALGETRAPARYAVYRVVTSTTLSLALMKPLGVLGVVLGAVAAAFVESVALALRLRKLVGGIGLEHVRPLRLLLLAAATAGTGLGVRTALPHALASTPTGAACVLGAAGIAFVFASPALGLLDLRTLLRRNR
jgi:putative peptidoglycan lipid II flippase